MKKPTKNLLGLALGSGLVLSVLMPSFANAFQTEAKDEFVLQGSGDTFRLFDQQFEAEESFVYSADLSFVSGQAGGLVFGGQEQDHYYVLNMDRYENRVKLLYFHSNGSGGYQAQELLSDYFIGNNKITGPELDMVCPQVRNLSNLNLKIEISFQNSHAFGEFYVEGIKRFGIDSIIDLTELNPSAPYQGGFIGMNCFNSRITLTNVNAGEKDVNYFNEPYRNQFHLQSFSKWTNDPNGLCYHNGYYHVYYQTNPFGIQWGDMYWGHARSRDLIHFELLPICLFPETEASGFGNGNGFMWSGCALSYKSGMSPAVDELNWFSNGNGDGMLAFFTRAGGLQDQIIMSSDDDGLTWTKRRKIPQTISGYNDFIDWRDPKVFPLRKDNAGNVTIWGMTLSSMHLEKGWFLKSENLLDWSLAGSFNFPWTECIGIGFLQDQFGNEHTYLSNKSRTYLFGDVVYDDATGQIHFYDEEDIDISTYSLEQMEAKLKPLDFGPDSYASQSFYINDEESEFNGKEIVLNWFSCDPNTSYATGTGAYADLRKRWNGGFTIPVEYGVLSTDDGLRLTQQPVTVDNPNLEKSEILNLSETLLESGNNPLRDVDTHIFELSASIETSQNKPIVFKVDIGSNEYMEFGWNSSDGYYVDRTHLDHKGIAVNTDWHAKYASHILGDTNTKSFYVLSDNGSLEVFCEDYSIGFYFLTTASPSSTKASLEGDGLLIHSLKMSEIASIYNQYKPSDFVEYIEMNVTAFENYTESAGNFANRYDGYWGENYSFHALDTFFRGETGSSSNTSLILRPWKQATQYVYFTWGGAPDFEKDGQGKPYNYLKFYCGDEDEYVGELYNDTFLGNAMMLRYFEIPAEEYNALMSKYPGGFDMRIELVDNKPGTEGYAFHNFGYLHANQTLQDTSRAMYQYLNFVDEGRSEIDIKTIQGHYYGNAGLRSVFYAPFPSIEDGFDYQDRFQQDWYLDRTCYNGADQPRHLDKAISSGSYRPGSSRMPFNKTGNGFFRGWYEESEDSGFIFGDGATYRFISHPFILSSSGIVSIKMAGTASLRVIDATANPGNDQAADLAYISNVAFNAEGGEILINGFNTCTMVRHVINLSAYAGRTVQLAISDHSSGGWGAAYFDELRVNVDMGSSGFRIDAVTQNHENGSDYWQVYPDLYVATDDVNYVSPSGSVADSSDAKAAHGFIADYLAYAKADHGQADFCSPSILNSDYMKGLIGNYSTLPSSVKSIIDASNDYRRLSGDWATAPVEVFNLSDAIEVIARANKISLTATSLSRMTAQGGFSSQYALVLLIGFASIVSFSAFFFVKRKQNEKE